MGNSFKKPKPNKKLDVALLRQGDIIAFKRLFFTHYALYIGDGMVIHRDKFAGKAQVAITYLSEIPGEPYVANEQFSGLKRVSTETSIKNAKDRIGETRYNLLTANCEHFVTEHRYNVVMSNQVRQIKSIVICALGLSYACIRRSRLRAHA
jgi:hypothetical protein